MRTPTIACFFAGLVTLSPTAAFAEQIWLTMDQVSPYTLEVPAGQIVVGNPAIADVTVQDKQRVLLFGKAPGMTNMYIFDDDGQAVQNLVVRVRSTTSDMLTMHRAGARTTYSCSSQCEPTITVGDDTASFSTLYGQVEQKKGQAQGASQD